MYLGGKARLAKRLASVMLSNSPNTTRFTEPFVGGCHLIEHVGPSFVGRARVADAVPDLAMLWRALRDGWEPPDSVSRDQYESLRLAEPSALRAFVGFGLFFGGKWFGGYASDGNGRDYCGQAKRGAMRKGRALRECGALVANISYEQCDVAKGDLIYCDPPYAGTTQYGAASSFDSAKFWEIVSGWSDLGAYVYVSEFTAPDGWECVFEVERKMSVRRKSGEPQFDRLFSKRIEG